MSGPVAKHVQTHFNAPLRILVTGDTHIGPRRNWLPKELIDGLVTADVVIHTGDISTDAALDLFRQYAPVIAVKGNNDTDGGVTDLPERVSIDIGGLSMEVVHGHLERGPTARRSVIPAYSGRADLVIFGHSHRVSWEEVDGTWFLNPGSSTMKRWEPQYSYAIVEVDDDSSFTTDFRYFDKQTRPDDT